jgi:hypothetical protein
MSLSSGIWLIFLPFLTKWNGASRCVPVCELRNKSSRLYPSVLMSDHIMNCGFGDPGKVGRDSDMESERSIGFISR